LPRAAVTADDQGTMRERAVLLDWFEPEELAECPDCGERTALSLPATETLICFGCGFVAFHGGSTSVSEIQGRERSIAADLAPRKSGLSEAKQHGIDLMQRAGDTHHLL
jgi:hypothetical protein